MVTLDFLDGVEEEGFNICLQRVVMRHGRLKAIVLVTSLIKLSVEGPDPLVLLSIMLLDIAEDLLFH